VQIGKLLDSTSQCCYEQQAAAVCCTHAKQLSGFARYFVGTLVHITNGFCACDGHLLCCCACMIVIEQSAAESRGGYSSSNSGNGGHSNSSAVAVPAGPHLGDRLMEGRIQQVHKITTSYTI
jgi:hypothetical protein